MANCKICGSLLTGKQRSYCCKECAEEGNRRNALARWYSNEEVTIECKNCGKKFIKDHRTQFCSYECSSEYQKKKYIPKGVRKFICGHCGSEFESSFKKIFCSKECASKFHEEKHRKEREEKRNSRNHKQCEICGKEFIDKSAGLTAKYCSDECRKIAWTKTQVCVKCGKEFKSESSQICPDCRPKATKVKCKVCGKETTNKTFCSKECQEKYHNEKRVVKICRECGKEFLTNSETQNRCSKECIEKHQSKIYTRECKGCGDVFTTKSEKQVYCSKKCARKVYNKNNELKRKRKVHENGKMDCGISLKKLIKKEKNICYLCGKECDSNDFYIDEHGTQISGDNYPSIEHVIPISKGGTHTWDNVRLAHRGCNSKKSNISTIKMDNEDIKFDI